MKNDIHILDNYQDIKNKIYTIRGCQVMLDRDLANLYMIETKVFKQAVKRNIDRFPSDFMFELTKEELEDWRSQFVTSNSDKMGLRRVPYVFTEQGVSMLSSILKSKIAISISVDIIRAFVNMRKFLSLNNDLFHRLDNIEKKQIVYEQKSDEKFENLFNAIESKDIKPKQGIFYDGQVFDAYTFVSDLIRDAESSIIILDNYIDDSVLTLLSKNQNINITIYTKTISKQLELDLKKYNTQYKTIEIKKFQNSHDRFIIIDEKQVYHIGASLKDLGKKWFAFSKLEIDSFNILERIDIK